MIISAKASGRKTMTEDPRCGWNSKFPHFRSTSPNFIRESLSAYVKDAGPAQVRAWEDAIPPLQNEVGEILHLCDKGKRAIMIKRKWTEKSSKIPIKFAGPGPIADHSRKGI